MNRSIVNCTLLAAFALAASAALAKTERVFREPRYTRGNTNLMHIQAIDDAAWLWHPDGDATTCRFEVEFDVTPEDKPFLIDVSADERFYLTLDGEFVGRGPHRGTVENWMYQTYLVTLPPGRHRFEAVVTVLRDGAPLAQMWHRAGFILKSEGAFDKRVSTGDVKANWKVSKLTGFRCIGKGNGAWGTGDQFEVTGSGPYRDAATTRPVVAQQIRGGLGRMNSADGGGRLGGWLLFPSYLPDQTETELKPGAFRAATHNAGFRRNHVYTKEETAAPEVAALNALLKEGRPFTVPPKTRLQAVWHLGEYQTAYPRLVTAGGKGAKISWTWTESSRNGGTRRKDDRGAIIGHYVDGMGDIFRCDGRAEAEFTAAWFRCGLWCRLDFETGDEPLVVKSLSILDSRYPVEQESVFSSPDDPSLAGIRRICTRAQQMCSHEMLFDCPYYEQQMYPGDTRIQLLVLSALNRDDRLIRRAIELYDLGTRDDGQCPFNWPTRGTQEGFTYTLCYLLMYGDYARNHADREWLRARIPGLRKTMAGCEYYENADGLIENTPGWNFMDWSDGWYRGTVPGCGEGRLLNAEANLFWLLAMKSAAEAERALGNELQARYWEEKMPRLKAAIIAKFYDGKRGLFADTAEKKTWSEHAQALALLGDVLDERRAKECFRHLVEDKDLTRTTVYFSYYLFEAYFKMGRADLFQNRLDLWRDYIKRGVTTLLESPENGQKEPRSDCHAWGAHPLWFMQTGFAGIRSAAPFFAKVLVAPQPGTLKSFKVRHPHPRGWIEAELAFEGGKVSGTVTTPVPGLFRYGGKEVELKAGVNRL